jgi:ABC-type branched-subunit amino acid transport system substrate-binding protein
MNLKRSALLFAALIVCAAALVACGGGGSSTSSAPESTSGSETAANAGTEGSSGSGSGSGEPIKIMTMASVGSPVASYPEVQEDATAAVDAINKEGGVNGHEIEDIFCDTKGDANVALGCAREAVKEHVVATVGNIDLNNTATFPVFEAGQIPVVGQWANGDAVDTESEWSFPLTSGSWGSYMTTIYAMKDRGVKKVTMVPLDFPLSINQAEVAEAIAEKLGIEVGEMVKIPLEGVTDYTPYSQQIKQSGAEAVIPYVGPAAFEGLMKADSAVGVEPLLGICIICGYTSPGALTGSAFPLAQEFKPFNEQREAAGLAPIAANDKDAYSGLNTWFAVHAFAEVAKKVKGEITNATFKEALEAAEGIDVEGALTWSPAELGAPNLGKYPRFQAGLKYSTFEIDQNGNFVKTNVPPVEDPLKAVR